jgi:putative hydrolase of the HAD superfamily
VIVTSEEAGCAKPDPWIFRRALDVLSADASSSWFVGDNPVAEVGGAEGAGLRAVWIGAGSTWPDELPPPRYAIHRLEQLLDLVRIA